VSYGLTMFGNIKVLQLDWKGHPKPEPSQWTKLQIKTIWACCVNSCWSDTHLEPLLAHTWCFRLEKGYFDSFKYNFMQYSYNHGYHFRTALPLTLMILWRTFNIHGTLIPFYKRCFIVGKVYFSLFKCNKGEMGYFRNYWKVVWLFYDITAKIPTFGTFHSN